MGQSPRRDSLSCADVTRLGSGRGLLRHLLLLGLAQRLLLRFSCADGASQGWLRVTRMKRIQRFERTMLWLSRDVDRRLL